MAFKDKLQAFLKQYDKLNSVGEEADEGFNSEFIQLKQETQQYKENNTFPAEAGQLPYNKKKNRFKDILPYEYTRVQLHKADDVEGSDYVNANYIQGADSSVTYIAAQGPLPHTVDDFWRMLWYHQIEIVVMACKLVEVGRKKCEQYWPELGETQMYGAIKVVMTNEESISDDFTVRELVAECQGEKQIIRQYHYNAWPDHGRPSSAQPIIRMIERIGDHRKRHDIPIVVHCSAGCGRTGTIIAIDYARALLLAEDLSEGLNVFSIVHEMRKQRPSMVQAKEQYVFVYVAIVELIKRILGNVPQAPPKKLNFEKPPQEVATPPTGVDENIYANIIGLRLENADSEDNQKRSSTSSLELPLHVPPKPLTRTQSGGTPVRPETKPPQGPKPSPPQKPKPRVRPEKREKPDTLPRKKPDSVPVPAPRKPQPPVPVLSSTPPTSTPNGKGYVNVPSGSPQVEESTYSVVQKTASLSRTSNTSTPKPPSNVSGTSIFDTFLSECSGVFTENEIKELAEGEDPSVAQELSYSLLGSVKESEIPPDIPVKTVESTQLLLGEIPSPVGPLAQQTSVDIYETPELPLTTPPSTSLAFTLPSNKGSQEDLAKPRKGKGGGLFKHKGLKNKSSDDVKTATHPQLGRAQSANVSPSKWSGQTMPTKRGGANDRYHFAGEMGFGIRIGKPKGPRPIPSNWNVPNGLVH